MRRLRGVSGEERRAARRARLLDAGLALFGTRGHHAVTVREVCTHAKLTERYFYESFDNLDALYRELFAQVRSGLKQAQFRALERAPHTPDGIVEATLRAFFEFVHDDSRRARILLVDAGLCGGMQDLTKVAIREDVELSRNLIAMLFPTLESDLDIDSGYIAQGLVGAAIFQFWRWAEEGFALPLEDIVRAAMFLQRSFATYAAAQLSKQAKQAMTARTTPG